MSRTENVPPLGRSWRTSGALPIVLGVVVAVLLLLTGSVVTLVAQHISASNENEATVDTFQDWRVMCPPVAQKNSKCLLMEDVTRQGQLLLRFVINSTDANTAASVFVPHGVLIDPGLGFSVAGGAMKVRPYETCDSVGCLALLTLDDDTLKALKTNANGQVVVVPGNGSPVAIPFSLKGFPQGFDRLGSANGSRSFWSFLSH